MCFLRSACHSVLVMRPVTHSTILTIIHDREKVGDVKDYQDHCFDGYSKLLVGRCLLVLFNLNVCSCVQFSEVCTCMFSLPVSRPATENVRLKNGLMGIANMLKGLRVIFEQVFGFMLIMSKNSKNRMSFFMHTLYLNIENINEYIDLVYKGWVDEWMKDIII